jgi:type II secretory pathway pseudopilin PulG
VFAAVYEENAGWHDACCRGQEETGVTQRKADGFALIDLIFAMGIIGVLAATATPRLFAARQAAGSASAIGSLRSISSAQLTFALTCGSGFYAPNLTTLGVAPPASNQAFLSPNLTSSDIVTRGGYVMQLRATAYAGAPASCNGLAVGRAGQAFKAGADPSDPVQNFRYFAINANGSIFEDVLALYPVMPEAGEPPSGHLLR